MKPSDLAKIKPQHIILFGDPKTGKSTLAAELMKHDFRLTWISMDNGYDVVFKMGLSMDELDNHLNIVCVPDSSTNLVARNTCMKIMSGARCHICYTHGRVDCVVCRRVEDAGWSIVETNSFDNKDILVFDHLGVLDTSIMNQIMLAANKDSKNPMGEDDYIKIEWPHYSAQGFYLDQFLKRVQNAPFNIICIAHVTESTMEDGVIRLLPSIGTTNFSRNTGKFFDSIVYTSILNGKHRVGSSTTYLPRVAAGSRSDIKIEDQKGTPTLSVFFSAEARKEREEMDKKVEVVTPTTILNNSKEVLLARLEMLKKQREGNS